MKSFVSKESIGLAWIPQNVEIQSHQYCHMKQNNEQDNPCQPTWTQRHFVMCMIFFDVEKLKFMNVVVWMNLPEMWSSCSYGLAVWLRHKDLEYAERRMILIWQRTSEVCCEGTIVGAPLKSLREMCLLIVDNVTSYATDHLNCCLRSCCSRPVLFAFRGDLGHRCIVVSASSFFLIKTRKFV